MKSGEKLRFWRKENKLSAKEVAEKIGISQPMLTIYENGKSALSDKYLKNLHECYGLSIDWLLSDNTFEDDLEIMRKNQLLDIFHSLETADQIQLLNIAKTFPEKKEFQQKEMQSSSSKKAG